MDNQPPLDRTHPFKSKMDAFHRKVRYFPKPIRISAGFFLAFGGLLGFLPILGFWMLPLGCAVLAVDFPIIQRVWDRLFQMMARWKAKRGQKKKAKADERRYAYSDSKLLNVPKASCGQTERTAPHASRNG